VLSTSSPAFLLLSGTGLANLTPADLPFPPDEDEGGGRKAELRGELRIPFVLVVDESVDWME
jgi:hypothetical protein